MTIDYYGGLQTVPMTVTRMRSVSSGLGIIGLQDQEGKHLRKIIA
jgi:hypothetical protein